MTKAKRKAPVTKKAKAGFALMCADDQGQYWDVPGFLGAGRSGDEIRLPRRSELSPLPPGAVLQFAPDRAPLAWEQGQDTSLPPTVCQGALALAAQLPSGWTRTLMPAWERSPQAKDLPFFGYTAVFFHQGQLWCAALPTENNPRWKPEQYGRADLPQCIAALKKRFPSNRLLQQLEICALQYGCYNAQNVFYGRWEGAVPVSPNCNARCRGCISQQPNGAPPSPQIRLQFVPTVEETVQLGLHHLQNPEAILAFGQGCEGEPLMQAQLIADTIVRLRQETDRGTLHINSNGSLTAGAVKTFEAGLNSIRVSLCSVVESTYNAYYQPHGYALADVKETVRQARERGVWVSLNLLLWPGLNDRPSELEALIKFVQDYHVNMIQLRTLNMDPDYLSAQLSLKPEPSLGIDVMLQRLAQELPHVRLGNHNPHLRP